MKLSHMRPCAMQRRSVVQSALWNGWKIWSDARVCRLYLGSGGPSRNVFRGLRTGHRNCTGNNVVVNATMPGHPLGNGIVVRDVTPNANGTSTIQNYGEGNGRLQAPGSPIASEINNVWASPSMRPPSPNPAPAYDVCTSHPGAC